MQTECARMLDRDEYVISFSHRDDQTVHNKGLAGIPVAGNDGHLMIV